ncbi:MAG: SprB repeat-containing protein, partial [Bacteroidota bacterium]
CRKTLSGIVIENTCNCDARAGSITALETLVCADGNAQEIAACASGNAFVPAGFELKYLLTQGADLTIVAIDSIPRFEVSEVDTYTIHTLVCDPTTLDLSNVQLGQTTVTALANLLIQGGGDICAALDMSGAKIQLSQPQASIQSVQADLCEQANGRASLAPATNTYQWSDGGMGAERSQLAAGTYEVVFTDANGCTGSLEVIIPADCYCVPPELKTALVQSASCGNADGAIELVTTQDPANYTYEWNPQIGTANAIGNIRSQLSAGIYSVTITNALFKDCFIVEEIAIGNENGPTVESIQTTKATCASANGTALLLPSNWTYLWAHDNVSGNSRTDLAAGLYRVVVIDPANPDCPNIISVEIEKESLLTAVSTVEQEPDCGEQNGIVRIEPVPTTGAYRFSWNDGLVTTSAVRSNLASGTYEVTVTDTLTQCTAPLIFALTDQMSTARISMQSDQVMVSCAGEQDGVVAYEISYFPGFAMPSLELILDAKGRTYENGRLPKGSYCILLLDANGCMTAEQCFEVGAPDEINVQTRIVDQSCSEMGRIELDVEGGSGRFSFDWSDRIGSDDPQNRNDCKAGLYHVTITDFMGCSVAVQELRVGSSCSLICTPADVSDINVTESSCGNSNGQIELIINGYPAIYDYTWNPAVGTPNANGNQRSNLPAGTYDITITNQNDPTCALTQIVVLGNEDGPEVELVLTTPTECDAATGTANLRPTNLDYDWSDGDSGPERAGLAGGIYQVTVTDPNTGCFDVIEVTVRELNPLDSEVSILAPSCGEANGAATIIVSGGSGDYTYSWGAGPNQTDLTAGRYLVTVTDNQSSCEIVVDFVLDDPTAGANIVINTPVALTSCVGSNDGSVDFDFTLEPGFVQPQQIAIVDANGNNLQNGNLPPGDYCITITDGNACQVAINCFQVREPEAITASTNIANKDCDENGRIELLVSGGTGSYTYNWSDLAGNNNPQNRDNLADGAYSVIITDENNCSLNLDNLIVEDDCVILGCTEPQVQSVSIQKASCNQADGAATVNVVGDPADFTFSFTPNAGTGTGNSRSDLTAGSYSVRVARVSDPNCFTEINFIVSTFDGPVVTILTTPASCLDNNGTAQLAPNFYSYQWFDGLANPGRNDLAAGTYSLTVTDPATNCIDVVQVTIGQINELRLEANIQQMPDCNAANGVVEIVVEGGSGNYTYSWGASAIRNDLQAGTFDVSVTDNINGCTGNIAFVLMEDVVEAAVNVEPTVRLDCAGDQDGQVNFVVTPEPGFNGTPVVLITDVNGNTFLNGSLAEGDYCVVVRDAAGCVAGQACFEVVAPPAISLNTSVQNKDCNTLGSIALTVAGGTAPYTYDWADLNGANNPKDRTNLDGGFYNLIIRDANGCESQLTNIQVIDDCLVSGCDEPVLLNAISLQATCG